MATPAHGIVNFAAHITNEQQQRGNMNRATSTFQDYLYMPDPTPLHMLWATVAANLARPDTSTEPLWLMLVGPPSCGKSTLLQSLSLLPNVHYSGTLTASGLLTIRTKDAQEEATGGLLMSQIKNFGFLVMPHFHNTLAEKCKRIEMLEALSYIASNKWPRATGLNGGMDALWEGKCCILAAANASIDAHRDAISLACENFVYVRMGVNRKVEDLTGPWMRQYLRRQAGEHAHVQEKQERLAQASSLALQSILENAVERPELTEEENWRTHSMAVFCSKARSGVTREQNEVTSETTGWEEPHRLRTQFAQLFSSLLRIGVAPAYAWQYLDRLMWDTIPYGRREFIKLFLRGPKGVTYPGEMLENALQVGRRLVEKIGDSLAFHGVFAVVKKRGGTTYTLSEDFRALYGQVSGPPPERAGEA